MGDHHVYIMGVTVMTQDSVKYGCEYHSLVQIHTPNASPMVRATKTVVLLKFIRLQFMHCCTIPPGWARTSSWPSVESVGDCRSYKTRLLSAT